MNTTWITVFNVIYILKIEKETLTFLYILKSFIRLL